MSSVITAAWRCLPSPRCNILGRTLLLFPSAPYPARGGFPQPRCCLSSLLSLASSKTLSDNTTCALRKPSIVSGSVEDLRRGDKRKVIALIGPGWLLKGCFIVRLGGSSFP